MTFNMNPSIFHAITCSLTALLLAAGALSGSARAEVITLSPVADTTLFETNPDNNMGADRTLVGGSTARGLRSRALIKFDFSAIPDGATITAVSLQIQAVKSPSFASADSSFSLRRVLVSWIEGTKAGTLGAIAETGEPTWKNRAAPSTPWGEPGGAAGSDYASEPSASVQMSGPGTYTFASNAGLVADAQLWLEQPELNFGWALVTDQEQTTGTARRLASREDPSNGPALRVEYASGSAPIMITSIVARPSDIAITWTGGSPPYQLEEKAQLKGTSWVKAGSVSQTNSAVLPMSGPHSFFRVAEAR